MNVVPEAPTVKNPPERFTGDVWVNGIAAPQEADQRMIVARVRFAPATQTAGHSHQRGQTLQHLAMLENGEDATATTTWLEQVSNDDYGRAAGRG